MCVFDLLCVLNYPFVEIRSQCHLQRRVFVCVLDIRAGRRVQINPERFVSL